MMASTVRAEALEARPCHALRLSSVWTGNYQVSVPKPLRDQLGLKLGDLLDTSIERGVGG